MKELIEKLKQEIEGEVREDRTTKRVYSVDASIFEVEPLCVVTPKGKEDVVRTVQLAKEYEVPVTPRGAATGITGGCLGTGVVIDCSKYMDRILKVDIERGIASSEPGVVQDRLNEVLAKFGKRLGPDTSTGNRATLGGMLANNAAGARSLKYGRMVDAVVEVEIVLEDGEVVRFGEISAIEYERKKLESGAVGRIYRGVSQILAEYGDEIEKKFPRIPRRVSGYNLDALLVRNKLNLSQLIAGSEGTLGIVTELTTKIASAPQETGLLVMLVDDMLAGMEALPELLELNPISLEVMDHHLIAMGKQSKSVKNKLGWLQGNPQAVFTIELEEGTLAELEERLAKAASTLKKKKIGYGHSLLIDPDLKSHIWQVRKAGLGLLMSKRSFSRAIAFIEDISVPPEKLAGFLREYLTYMQGIGKDSGIYGHAGSGCMHIRPYMDVRDKKELELMKEIMRNISFLLKKYGGALSGEHGDGLVRSWLNEEMFGEKIYRAFLHLKRSFDPKNLMNSGKIVFPASFDENRRMDDKREVREIETFLDFSREGGFSLAADMCNGNAECRKLEGVMCPSFQASHEEFHTTRARAQVLRSIITGREPLEAFTGEGLKAVLDLCIECKGCKRECPSEVDMAKMKAEFLYHYQEKHGYKFRDRVFANTGKINRAAQLFAKGANIIARSSFAKYLQSSFGIAPERLLPLVSEFRFTEWARKNPSKRGDQKVVLFVDTFTEFNEPRIGIAAQKLLEKLGFQVIISGWQCCGRTLISKGFLADAKKYAEQLVSKLLPYAEENLPIVGLEPSCISALRDDFEGLLGYGNAAMRKVKERAFFFDEFLYLSQKKIPLKRDSEHVLFHNHCHQKSLGCLKEGLELLKQIPQLSVNEIATGCCGMAGAFGYEKEHYAFSVKVAELKLVPTILQAPRETQVVTNGFSCRHQIAHLTDKKPLHLAEMLYRLMIK